MVLVSSLMREIPKVDLDFLTSSSIVTKYVFLKQRAQRFCGDRFGRMLLGSNTNSIHITFKVVPLLDRLYYSNDGQLPIKGCLIFLNSRISPK